MATTPPPPVPRKALWDAMVRFEPEKVHLWMGIRSTIGIMIPAEAGALLGNATGWFTGGGRLPFIIFPPTGWMGAGEPQHQYAQSVDSLQSAERLLSSCRVSYKIARGACR